MDRAAIIFSFLLFALVAGAAVHGFPKNDLISNLPNQPNVNFRQFAGHIDIDDKAGRSLFYYFVEAEKDAKTKPLTIWLTGGPGCSSVGDGFASVGPFVTTNNARGLQRNLFSWNKASNLLFIDSPIGVGWSYSNSTGDYSNGDDSSNKNLITFLLKWYEKYPNFKCRDVYLAGSSFAGHFVSNLANSLLDYSSQSKVNLKGVTLGNPVLRRKLDILARFDLFLGRGMINTELHQQILKECNGNAIDENNYFSNMATIWTAACTELMNKATLIAFKTDDGAAADAKLFDILRDPCTGTVEDLKLGKEVTWVSYGVEMCLYTRAGFYFNLPEVQKAFHGNRTKLSYEWRGCFSSKFKYNEADKDLDMLLALKRLLQQSVPITIVSGDQDAIIPTMGTLKHLNKLAEDLNLKLTKNETWIHANKIGGRKYSFGDLLTFMTVKDANHHVTVSRPSEALYIFTTFTINRAQ